MRIERIEQGRRLKEARLRAGYPSAAQAAQAFGWPESTYRTHEKGTRTIGLDDADRYARRYKVSPVYLLHGVGEPETSLIPLMGYIGAGAEIDPDYAPDDGLADIELRFPIAKGAITFQVRGDSMMPRYDPGDVIVCWRVATRSLESCYGKAIACQTTGGKRYLKRVVEGGKKNTVDLESLNLNTPTMRGVKLDWFSDIYLHIPADQVRKVERVRSRQT